MFFAEPAPPSLLSEPLELGFSRLLPAGPNGSGALPVGALWEWKLARSSGASPACLPFQLPHPALSSRSLTTRCGCFPRTLATLGQGWPPSRHGEGSSVSSLSGRGGPVPVLPWKTSPALSLNYTRVTAPCY